MPSFTELSAYYEAKGKAGYRVLALATRAVRAKGSYHRDDETGMNFEGFLLFLDPPKADAARAGLPASHSVAMATAPVSP